VAKLIEAAGIAVHLIRCKGMIHGFLRWTGAVPAAHRWIDDIADAARATLGANA
jgi:acetyl esterase/lipase